MSPNSPVERTRRWVNEFVIQHNLCPFAKQEVDAGKVFYREAGALTGSLAQRIEAAVSILMEEIDRLQSRPAIATSIIIYPHGFDAFDEYLDLLTLANSLMDELGHDRAFQLASFHPHYCFEGEAEDAPGNYTNRSPLPLLHLLRQADVTRAVRHHGDAEAIPAHNIKLMNRLGLARLKALTQQ